MQLIPAIDLRHGKVVRLQQGDDARQTVYGDDPLAVLEGYGRAGIGRVHVVDLDAAFGEEPQRDLVEELVAVGAPAIQLGGGLRDEEAMTWALTIGVERLVVGSMLVKDPDLFLRFSEACPGRLVPALDCLDGGVRISGWKSAAPTPLSEVCRRLRSLPCPAVLVTDIGRDGTLEGPNVDLARRVAQASGLPALLSGGVHSLDDLRQAAAVPEIDGAIVGKALFAGIFTVEEAVAACASAATEGGRG